MKINSKVRLREIAGEHILVNQGVMGVSLTRVISLNESAVLLFNQLAGRDFSLAEATRILMETYGLPEEQAGRDASAWVEALIKCGVIQ